MPTKADIEEAPYLRWVKMFTFCKPSEEDDDYFSAEWIIDYLIAKSSLSPADMESLCAYLGQEAVLREVLAERAARAKAVAEKASALKLGLLRPQDDDKLARVCKALGLDAWDDAEVAKRLLEKDANGCIPAESE